MLLVILRVGSADLPDASLNYMYIGPFVRPSVCLSFCVCSLVRPFVCLFFRLFVLPSVDPSFYLFVSSSIVRLSILSSVHPSGCPSVRLSVRPSIRPSGQPSFRLFVSPLVRPSVRSSISFVRLSFHPFILLFVCLLVCLMFVCLFFPPSILQFVLPFVLLIVCSLVR